MGMARPSSADAGGGKIHGRQPRGGFDQCNPIKIKISTAKKRSLKRAYYRAQKEGFAWYKGRILLPTEWNTSRTDGVPSSDLQSQKIHKSSRFSMLSWNIGGMSTAKYDQVVNWLTNNSVDIALLQETHWYQTDEWTCKHYHVIHSSSGKHKSGGLMCFISKKWAKDQISWRELDQGRLLHVRLHGKRCIDIINGYQYTVHKYDQTCIENRSQWVDKLDHLISDIPHRNLLYIGADMNTSMQKSSSVIGLEHFVGNTGPELGTKHTDSRYLHAVLKKHGLVALNTWIPSPPTFTSHAAASRIDYLLTRSFTADKLAKEVKYLTQHPLYALTGPRHCPMMTTVRSSWIYNTKYATQQWTLASRKKLYTHCKMKDEYWQNLQLQVESCFNDLETSPPSDLSEIHSSLNTVVKPVSHTQSENLNAGSMSLFQLFQDCTIILRAQRWKYSSEDLRTCFEVWKLANWHDKLRHQMKVNAKQKRKDKIQQVMQQAAHAEQARDQYTFYQCIRQLAPKQPYKRIMLRGTNGELLSPADSADQIAEWIQTLYDGPDLTFPNYDEAWPLEEVDLIHAFKKFSNTKALSPEYVPATIWKASASSAAKCVHQFVTTHYNVQATPDQWSSGDLVFLAKPGKTPTKAANLRPIALIEPTGKAILGAISKRLVVACWSHLCAAPQFAYLRHRSSVDAIGRVANHCMEVQTLLNNNHHPILKTARGNAVPKLFGGILLCLDLTKAFDTVNRDLLLTAMQHMNAPPEIISLVHRLYACTHFTFSHRGEFRKVRTRQGIRQGCKAAPTLWAIYITYVLQYFGQLTDINWVLRCVTVYADDWCLHDSFTSWDDAEIILARMGILMDLLASFGLISNDKTVALIQLRGSQAKAFQKKHMTYTKEASYLNVPRRNNSCMRVKTMPSHSYLGVTLHYMKLEQQTMNTRIRQSTANSYLLQKWLGKGSVLNLKQKLKIWYQCIFTSVTYGIFHIGLTPLALRSLDIFFFRQLRRICQSPIHLTKQNNQDFLRQFHLKDPLQVLLDRCIKLLEYQPQRLNVLLPEDILHTSNTDRLHRSCEILQTFLQQRRVSGPCYSPSQHRIDCCCVICHKSYNTVADLRGHQTRDHGILPGPIRLFHSLDSYDGLPVCVRCNMEFADWKKLHHHVTWTCLQARPDERPDITAFQQKQELFKSYARIGIDEVAEHPELCSYFTQRCLLCNRYTTGGRCVQNHHLAEHPQAYALHLAPYTKLLADSSHLRLPNQKCKLCHKDIQKTHTCVILKQLAMLAADGTLDAEERTEHQYRDGESDDLPRYVCQECGKIYLSKQGLDMHAISHVTPDNSFDAARDVTSKNCCAHCGGQYSCNRSVMIHIQMGRCDQFDPNRRLQTMLENDMPLRAAVEAGDFSSILKNPEWVAILGKTCGLCQRPFTMKNSLSQHLQGVHAPYWIKAAQLAGFLTAKHQTKTDYCYCLPKARINDRHQCVIFKQLAMLRLAAFPELDNSSLMEPHARHKESVLDLPIPLAQSRKLTDYFQCRSESYVDQLSDDSLAQILQQWMIPARVDPSNERIDPYDSNIMDTEDKSDATTNDPSFENLFSQILGQGAECFDDYVAQMLCTQLDTGKTRLLIHQGLDRLLAEPWVSELAVKCSMCDIKERDPSLKQVTWNHLVQHVVSHCPEISVYVLGKYAERFLKHQDLLAIDVQDKNSVLQQIFIVRFLFHYGCGWRCKATIADDLATHPDRGHAGDQKTSFGHNSKRTQSSQTSDEKFNRSTRSKLDSDAQDDGHTCHQTRGPDLNNEGSGRVHHPYGSWRGLNCQETDDQNTAMASDKSKDGTFTASTGLGDDHHPTDSIPTVAGSQGGLHMLPDSSAGAADHQGWQDPVSNLESPAKTDDYFISDTHQDGRNETIAGESEGGFSGRSHCGEIALHETDTRGSRELQLGVNSLVSDAVEPGALGFVGQFPKAFLQQHLATSGSAGQASQNPEEHFGTNLGQESPEPMRFSLRIFSNPTGVLCYMNASIQGLVWLAIRMHMTSSNNWNDDGAMFQIATHLTPVALDVSSHDSFKLLIRNWSDCYSLKLQHDASEFLNFLVTALQPSFWNASWVPRWTLGNDVPDGEYEKGVHFSTIQLSLTEGNFDTSSSVTLVELIESWHDAKVHQRGLNSSGSFAFVIGRNPNGCAKLNTAVILPENMVIGIPNHNSNKWPKYQIIGVTLHKGNSIASGHYTTSVYTIDNRWFHYDDDCIPTQRPLTHEDSKNITIVWISGC